MTLDYHFIKKDLKVTKWQDLAPYFQKLSERNITSKEDLEKLIQDYSEVLSVYHETGAWSYINMTCDTENAEYLKVHETFNSQIAPEAQKQSNIIDRKITSNEHYKSLNTERYEQFQKETSRDLELFREDNIPLNAELMGLATKYNQIAGGLTADWNGEKVPLPQMRIHLKDKDRNVRKAAWEASTKSRLDSKNDHDQLYDEMIQLRHKVALNAGYDNFRNYKHDELHRFDYTPQDVLEFHDSVEKYVVPLANQVADSHREKIGLAKDDYRPWDIEAVPDGEAPLKPFQNSEELIEKTIEIFTKLNPSFGENLKRMRDKGHFDLDSRKGKAPGGYNAPLEVTGMPFIFMNSSCVQRDVVTMMHEGGHAMHTFLTNEEPLISYRNAHSEMAETASMAMELMSAHLWSEFYNPEDYKRARREHFEGIINMFPNVMTIDAFQHWVYTNVNHSSEERDQEYLNIANRFKSNSINWDGNIESRKNGWQTVLHIFEVPFYYIEYAIAQLGALQVYRNFKKDPEKALQDYINGLKLGNSIPIPEVWNVMNIKFDFSSDTIKELMDFVKEELESFA